MNHILTKILVITILVQSISCYEIPEAVKKSLLALHDKCIEQTDASIAHLQKCRTGYIPEDHDAKCYLDCMLSQSNQYDLEKHFQWIEGIKHEINDDIHKWKSHVNDECDMNIDHHDKCEEAWQKVNCYLKTHNDTMEYCILFMFQEKYLN
uniref:CSON008183 protein n=1 Tax=Culicoides sonorensis TaxID=179676 RepID=A0A336N7E4_CULSO